MFGIFGKLNGTAKLIVFFIALVFFSAVVLSLVIKKQYDKIHKDFEKGKEEEKFSLSLLNKILKTYKRAADSDVEEINTQAIIEKEFSFGLKEIIIGERFIKHAVSLMIILGLLGTFFGLTISIDKLVDLLGNSESFSAVQGMDGIISGLIESIKGMSVAFVTSLFGICGAILLTVLKIFINTEKLREQLMIEIEEYLDNVIATKFINYAKKNTLEVTMNSLFQGLSEQIEINYKNVLDKSVSGLIEVAKLMEKNEQSLNNSLICFEHTIDKFCENTRDFGEFNHHLRNNVDRMNVALSDFTEKIKNR
jgi:hypothetical protein